MDYKDIIRDNADNHSPVSWWAKFAFHCTDVTNAVSILSSGFLYSRADASKMRIMRNDNASRQVIDMTSSKVVSKVRFYFRPLTPTQYYNEGYKHPDLRFEDDENANIPVPIFFLFDLDKLLNISGVEFSEKTQAGRGSMLYSGVEAFSRLNFDFIYNNDQGQIGETKQYRQAEILHPNSLSIDTCISNILCRNNLEKTTLLNLLRETNPYAFEKYHSLVKVYKQDTFENNGIFISECSYCANAINIVLSDTYSAKRYMERMIEKKGVTQLKPIKVSVLLKWFNAKTIIHQETLELNADITKLGSGFTITKLPSYPRAKDIGIKVFFDDKLMCYAIQSLDDSEVLR